MSHFDTTETTTAPALYAQTLMMYDIRALQVLYGVNDQTRAGATVYGFHASAAGSVYDFAVNARPLLCIWDGGGTDEIHLSGYGGRQRLDLRAGQVSDVGGFANNRSIALGSQIENGTGGRGNDLLIGSLGGNRLKGMAGADVLIGGAGMGRSGQRFFDDAGSLAVGERSLGRCLGDGRRDPGALWWAAQMAMWSWISGPMRSTS